ncbi:Glucose-6-phosphate isomerase [Dirofilaria immitis]
MNEDEGWASHSRKHKNKKDKYSTRRRHQDQRFEVSEGKDDISCCGRPRRKNYFHRRKHRHHYKKHKSKHRSKSRKEMSGTKDEIPSPLRPPIPLPQQSSALVAVTKEKQKEDKESAEMANTNQGKISTSGEIGGKPSSQMATSSSPPALASRDSQKVEGHENLFQLATMKKTELLQELCVTQCIRDGYEISRMAYTTCFPVCKKPNFIYLPQLRFTAKRNADSRQNKSVQQTGTDLSQEIKQPIHMDSSKVKNFMMEAKISHFVQNLNECHLALRKALRNISNLKLLAAGEVLNEVQKYDTDTKAIINDLKYLRQLIDKKFEI